MVPPSKCVGYTLGKGFVPHFRPPEGTPKMCSAPSIIAMEDMGLEPMTSCMPCKLYSQLS